MEKIEKTKNAQLAQAAWADYVNSALERSNFNREIEVANQRLRQLKACIGKLKYWLKEEQQSIYPPHWS